MMTGGTPIQGKPPFVFFWAGDDIPEDFLENAKRIGKEALKASCDLRTSGPRKTGPVAGFAPVDSSYWRAHSNESCLKIGAGR